MLKELIHRPGHFRDLCICGILAAPVIGQDDKDVVRGGAIYDRSVIGNRIGLAGFVPALRALPFGKPPGDLIARRLIQHHLLNLIADFSGNERAAVDSAKHQADILRRDLVWMIRIQRSGRDHTECFIQDNYYYLCAAEDEPVSQELDNYEAKESYRLEFIDPATAIEKNRSVRKSPYNRMMFEREALVLEMLQAEGLLD